MPSPNEIRQQITNEIISSLQKGIVPWKQPWSCDPNCGRPTNAVTKKLYNGVNVLLLGLHNRDYMSHGKYFATYKQWQSLGGQVMARPAGVPKGRWGCRGIFFKPISKTKTNRKGEEIQDNFCVMRQFTVFNIDQVEGEHLDHLRPGYCDNTDTEVSFREADELIANTDAGIMHGGNKANYDPSMDIINMPFRHQFDGASYYETLFHEMAHWTEHPDRLNWGRDDDQNSYALGELVSEFSSCYVCSELGLPLDEGIANHASYLGGWLKSLNDPSFIFRASTQASKAADYLLSFRSSPVESLLPA